MTASDTPTALAPSAELLLWGRRARVFLFIGAALLVFLFAGFNEIADNPAFFLDDVVVGGVAAAILAIGLLRRNSQSVSELRSTANIAVVLLAVGVVFKVAGVVMEAGHPDDVGDDIPGVYVLLVGIANRFL